MFIQIDSIHLYVSDLSSAREHYVDQLGFRQAGLSGAEFERVHGARASLLESGQLRLILMTPLSANSACAQFLAQHGDGVARIVLEVGDAALLHTQLRARDEQLDELHEQKIAGGTIRWFDVAGPLAPLQLRLVQYEQCERNLPGLVCRAPRRNAFGRFGVGSLDHLKVKVPALAPCMFFLEQALGFQRYWGIEFQEAEHRLRSLVMWQPTSGLKLVIEESAAHRERGCSIEQIAVLVEDVQGSVRAVQAAGGQLSAPSQSYYQRLPERLLISGIEHIGESVDDLRQLCLEVRAAAPRGYRLQASLDALPGLPVTKLIEQKRERGLSDEEAA